VKASWSADINDIQIEPFSEQALVQSKGKIRSGLSIETGNKANELRRRGNAYLVTVGTQTGDYIVGDSDEKFDVDIGHAIPPPPPMLPSQMASLHSLMIHDSKQFVFKPSVEKMLADNPATRNLGSKFALNAMQTTIKKSLDDLKKELGESKMITAELATAKE
jgi:hypothetical protein